MTTSYAYDEVGNRTRVVDADGNALVVSGLSRGAHVGTVGSAFAGEHGVLKLNSDGTYFYTVNPLDPMFRLLANGESLTDTFSYVATTVFSPRPRISSSPQ